MAHVKMGRTEELSSYVEISHWYTHTISMLHTETGNTVAS
jgi:hypothetical protein